MQEKKGISKKQILSHAQLYIFLFFLVIIYHSPELNYQMNQMYFTEKNNKIEIEPQEKASQKLPLVLAVDGQRRFLAAHWLLRLCQKNFLIHKQTRLRLNDTITVPELCVAQVAMNSLVLVACLMAACILQLSVRVEGRGVVALGSRPAVQPAPIIIPDEEVLGKPIDQVVEDQPADPVEVVESQASNDQEVVDPATGKQIAADPVAQPVDGRTTEDPEKEKKIFFGLGAGALAAFIILLIIIVALIIWLIVRHLKKKSIRAKGCNGEIASKQQIVAATGEPATAITIEPISAGTSDSNAGNPAPMQ